MIFIGRKHKQFTRSAQSAPAEFCDNNMKDKNIESTIYIIAAQNILKIVPRIILWV